MRGPRLTIALLLLACVSGSALAQGNETTEPSGPGEGLDVARLLVTVAAIIGLGFAGFIVFDRFRIADTIFLIGFGILLAWLGLLDVDLFRSFQPLVAVFAVLIIMFDAGLDLRFGDLQVPKMGWAIAFSLLGFAITILLVAGIAHYFLGVGWILSLILGCAVADTSGLVILPIINSLGVPGKVKTALFVETSLPDGIAITLVILLMNLAAPETAGREFGAGGSALGGITSTVMIGLLLGFLWIRALAWLADRRYAYMTTLAMVLAMNWAVNAIGGSGPVAVLLFGLVIGNRALFGSWSDTGRQKVFRDMVQFNGEVAFLVRSFFFVYLGVVLDPRTLSGDFVGGALLIVAAIIVARTIATYTMTLRPDGLGTRKYRGLLIAAIPRGTTAAVISTLPATRGIPGTDRFAGYAVLVILLTNLIFTVGLFLFFRRDRTAKGASS